MGVIKDGILTEAGSIIRTIAVPEESNILSYKAVCLSVVARSSNCHTNQSQ